MAEKASILVHRNVRTIASVSLISALIWTGFGVYYALTKPVDLSVPPEMLLPIDTQYDEQTLDALSRKRQISDEVVPPDFAPISVNEITTTPLSSPLPEPSLIPQESTTPSADVLIDESL